MPVIFLIIACLLNIVLDVWFVAGFHWNVAGVAMRHHHLSGGLRWAVPDPPAVDAGCAHRASPLTCGPGPGT